MRTRKQQITSMNRPIRITAVRRDPVDLDRFVAALLALALARLEAEREAAKPEASDVAEEDRD